MVEDPVVVALLSDGRFAVGAAVTGRALLDHRPQGSSTAIVVLDGGPSPRNRDRLVASTDVWDARVRRPHREYDFVRWGLRRAACEGTARRPWWGKAAGLALRRPWTLATFPAARARHRLRR